MKEVLYDGIEVDISGLMMLIVLFRDDWKMVQKNRSPKRNLLVH